eukprot:CAMPEP_0118705386 /NCGR_PEP_ID=MMETSP0800-20121206/19837_1 /TAXON_ID=210618 ORGANISM="Striatella unipunctata, Strain CCMP2910" /NCGR_SAMPLE_ID=MMETSP0800 /ASSEMBLY_ACC=CAM_ASM_000638 /LENGTH=294 /DNA_ID=CAMNT_0006607531 /DNA_START=191 /DNA_END=1075 /DNA_ORIENTATION=+
MFAASPMQDHPEVARMSSIGSNSAGHSQSSSKRGFWSNPWKWRDRKRKNQWRGNAADQDSEAVYYGDVMRSMKRKSSSVQITNSSSMIGGVDDPKSSTSTGVSRDSDSLETISVDFNANDWTPQDSSYGAAFPFCGWIPKRYRQAIEYGLIFLMGFLLVLAVVVLSIKFNSGRRRYNASNSENDDDMLLFDDFTNIDDLNYVVNDDDNADDFFVDDFNKANDDNNVDDNNNYNYNADDNSNDDDLSYYAAEDDNAVDDGGGRRLVERKMIFSKLCMLLYSDAMRCDCYHATTLH